MSAGAIGGAAAAANSSLPNRFSDMSSADFIRVLMTELTNQDPLEPTDSNALLEQLSSLRNIESQMDLQNRLEDLVLQNELSSASNMIGKMVRGLNEFNDRVDGLVTSIRIQEGRAYLELDTGHTLRADRVEELSNAAG